MSLISFYFSALSTLSSSYVTEGLKRTSHNIKDDPNRIKTILKTFHTDEEGIGKNSQGPKDKMKGIEEIEVTREESDDFSDDFTTSEDKNEYNENLDSTAAVHQSQRRLECLNEFTSNDKILSSSFFHLFLLGDTYDTSGSLTRKHRRHMLLQYTGHAARNHDFIFFIFDQMQRHGNVGGINAVVRSHRASFKRFMSLVTDKNFRAKVKEAQQNPQGKVAKEVMEIVAPVLTMGGNKTSFGSLERNDAITKINALCLRYGMPTLFLTIAIDDVNNFNS